MQASKAQRTEYYELIRDVLDVFADDLGTLYVTGSGDPFASRHYWELLTSDIAECYPSKWDELMERMAFIASICAEHSEMQLKINYVLQANNWRDMKPLVALAKQWGADIFKFSKINNWCIFSPSEYQKNSYMLIASRF